MLALPGHTSKQETGNNKKPLDRKTPIQVSDEPMSGLWHPDRRDLLAPVVAGSSSPSPVRSFDRREPVDGMTAVVLAARHLTTSVAQAGDGNTHSMRQPSKPLSDLGDTGALGSLHHGDQHCPLRTRSRWVSTGDTRRLRSATLRSRLGLQSGLLQSFIVGERRSAVRGSGFRKHCHCASNDIGQHLRRD